MPLQATSGAASYDGFGGGVAAVPTYIEDVFSTYLWTGNGTSGQTINNGIDLSGKGGLMWMKPRTSTSGYSAYWNRNQLYDTVRGIDQLLSSNTTDAQGTVGNLVTSVTSTGFTIGAAGPLDFASVDYVGWTFRKQPKFFDVVTWTGNDVIGREIPHNLGAVPGCIMVKQTNATRDWVVYHTSIGNTKYLTLNSTSPGGTQSFWNNTTPTSTVFTVGDWGAVNGGGNTYVAYLFASNAGGFGLTGTDNVISCGSFTGNTTVNLGYEPQWIIIKKTNAAGSWTMWDTMRGWSQTSESYLFADLANAESSSSNGRFPNATGFTTAGYTSTDTFIYIAIRRGPMKVPTSGTSVFKPVTRTGTGSSTPITGVGFSPDFLINGVRSGDTRAVVDKLRGPTRYSTTGASLEANFDSVSSLDQNGFTIGSDSNGWFNANGASYVYWLFKRSPAFLDLLCYTATGANMTVPHNLGAIPEMIFVKRRDYGANWRVYSSSLSNTEYLSLNSTNAKATATNVWNSTSPTASVFSLGTAFEVNDNAGDKYHSYLFSTCAGVSKCGSYTGTGALQTINCGFTSGARFVLIKRADDVGEWYVYDSARGITSGNDPYLFWNNTAAEVTGTNYIDTDTTGFKVTAAAPAELNASGGTYIFLAIA